MGRTDLIVNADDFGWSTSVNRGIVEAHQRGIVTSASLMANGEAFEDAVWHSGRNPDLGVGVHLNLIRGRALETPDAIPHLVDGSGRFTRGPARLLVETWHGRIPWHEIERELVAQVEKIVESGIRPTHLDSEKNLHGLPAMARVAIGLAHRFAIPAIRRVTIERPMLLDLGRKGFYKMLMLSTATRFGLGRHWRGREHVRRTVGMSQAGHFDSDLLVEVIRRLPPCACELMVHPGYVDEDSRRVSASYGGGAYIDRHREAELRALTHPDVLTVCRQAGVHLTHHGSLHRR